MTFKFKWPLLTNTLRPQLYTCWNYLGELLINNVVFCYFLLCQDGPVCKYWDTKTLIHRCLHILQCTLLLYRVIQNLIWTTIKKNGTRCDPSHVTFLGILYRWWNYLSNIFLKLFCIVFGRRINRRTAFNNVVYVFLSLKNLVLWFLFLL